MLETIESVKVLSLQDILSIANAHGHRWEKCDTKKFDPDKWTHREVDLGDSTIIPEARDEGELILKSGLLVSHFVLYEEIKKEPEVRPEKESHKINIPWAGIAGAIGTVVVAFIGLWVLGMVVSLLVTALAALIKLVVGLLTFAVAAVAIIGLLALDPVLVAWVYTGEFEYTENAETGKIEAKEVLVCIELAWWGHSLWE